MDLRTSAWFGGTSIRHQHTHTEFCAALELEHPGTQAPTVDGDTPCLQCVPGVWHCDTAQALGAATHRGGH